jgi:hypothetical protein
MGGASWLGPGGAPVGRKASAGVVGECVARVARGASRGEHRSLQKVFP